MNLFALISSLSSSCPTIKVTSCNSSLSLMADSMLEPKVLLGTVTTLSALIVVITIVMMIFWPDFIVADLVGFVDSDVQLFLTNVPVPSNKY